MLGRCFSQAQNRFWLIGVGEEIEGEGEKEKREDLGADMGAFEKDREKQTLTADDVKKATQILNTHKSAVKMGTPEYANHVALKAQQARFSDVSFKK